MGKKLFVLLKTRKKTKIKIKWECFYVFFLLSGPWLKLNLINQVYHLLKLSFRFPAWKRYPMTNTPSSPSATPTASVHPATGTPYVERTASPTSPPAWLAAPARPDREKTPWVNRCLDLDQSIIKTFIKICFFKKWYKNKLPLFGPNYMCTRTQTIFLHMLSVSPGFLFIPHLAKRGQH